MLLKLCRICKASKPVGDFYRSPRNAGGYATMCKACQYVEHKAWRQQNLLALRLYMVAYRLRNLGKMRERERMNAKMRRTAPGGKDAAAAKARRERVSLADYYVKATLVAGTLLHRDQLPEDLVEKKREQMLVRRAAGELKRALQKPEQPPQKQRPLVEPKVTAVRPPTGPPNLRACWRCQRTMPLALFAKDASRPFGRSYRCVECNRSIERESRARRKANEGGEDPTRKLGEHGTGHDAGRLEAHRR